MKKATIDNLVNAPWEKVAKVLLDEEYVLAETMLRDGMVSDRYELVSESDDEKVYKVHSVEYKRKKTGGLDKSTTMNTRSDYRWKAGKKTLSWVYHGDGGDRFSLSGIYTLTPQGEKTQLRHEVTVEIRIPLLGKQIEKFVIKEFEQPDPRYEKLMERYLDKLED